MVVSQKVKQLVRDRVGLAEDDLYRARAAFRRFNHFELNEMHGESGQTRAEVLKGYEKQVEDWKRELEAIGG